MLGKILHAELGMLKCLQNGDAEHGAEISEVFLPWHLFV